MTSTCWADRWLRLGAILLSIFAATACEAQPDAALEQIAQRYVETLFSNDLSPLAEFHDAAMKAALKPAQVRQLRAGLTKQLGELDKIGPPWLEDNVQGYARLRVPLAFETDKIDARVVVGRDRKVAGLFFVPHLARPAEDGVEPPGEELPVEVGEGGGALPGLLLIPGGRTPFAGVVLVHGSGPNDRDGTIGPNKPLRDIAWGLAESGIASLRYDKRTYAKPQSLASVGDALTVEHEVISDARLALRTLAAEPRVDSSRVYLIGHSLGASVLPRIPTEDQPVAGMVVLAGATLPLPEKIIEQTEYLASLEPGLSDAQRRQVDEVRRRMMAVRRALDGESALPPDIRLDTPLGYFADLEAHPPAKIAALAGRPILVLQGERDYQVTMRDYALWQQALSGKSFACLVSYPALDHLFRAGEGPSIPADYDVKKPIAPQVISDIAAWIRAADCPR